jgi:hypothetical protein
VPAALRSRLALLALLGAFLIPIVLSSLRGLTHVLTCEERATTPFTLIIPDEGPPQVLSSQRITAGSDSLCGGLSLLMQAGAAGVGRVRMVVAITNNTETPWRGTVGLDLQGVGQIPVDIGGIPPEETESDELEFSLSSGTHELEGSLLVGP